MATGDVKWFAQALLDCGKGLHNLATASLKLSLVKATGTAPAVTTADPRFGAAGTTDYSSVANHCTTGGNYTAPVALSNVSWSLVSNVPTLRADVITIVADASNPTDARYGIIYNDTDSGKRAIAFVDFGSTKDLTSGDFSVDWYSANNDILSLTQS